MLRRRLSKNLFFHAGAVFLSFCALSVARLNRSTGLCNVYTFIPFTDNGTAAQALSDSSDRVNPGFVHMAAALMAMEHFNARNTSVVPELKDYVNCRYKFDIGNSRMFDSGTSTHVASQSFLRAEGSDSSSPCAIAGPFHDIPALDLSVMAQSAGIPLVMHRSFNVHSLMTSLSPFSNQVYPDVTCLAEKAVEFLWSKGRTDYISIFYPMSDEGLQWRDLLSMTLQEHGMETFSLPIADPYQPTFLSMPSEAVRGNLSNLKDRGFRTIVVPLENPHHYLPLIADAAEELKMNNGDYFWVWLGEFSASHLYDDHTKKKNNKSNITKLIYGSVWINAIEKMYLDDYANNDTFRVAFTSQDADFAQRVNHMNPIPRGQPGHVFANPTFFSTLSQSTLEHGAAFMYDAVMSIGIGACLASDDKDLEVTHHLEGVRKCNFTGASGNVRFRGSGSLPGAREPSTAMLGAFNLLPALNQDEEGTHVLTDVFLPEQGAWEQKKNFTFADGTTAPPVLLRDTPPQNYLPNGYRIFGFILLGIVISVAMATSVWVYLKREHRVLRAAQPVFLHVLSFGAVVFSSAIIPLSFDESYGWSEAQLSAGCMSMPWLVSCGYIITYSALFAKLWRVNKVLQFTRRTIKVSHVAWPAGILVVAALVILGLWTGLDPVVWARVETDPYTGESVGYCQSNNMWAFAAPLAVVMLIPTLLTLLMAWKTRDVDEAYSESRWIFTLILVQAEVAIVGAPFVVILRKISTIGRYLGFVVIIWIFSMSTLLLIMLPKVMAYLKAAKGVEDVSKRGTRSGVKVSGIPSMESKNPHPSQFSSAEPAGRQISCAVESLLEVSESMHDSERKKDAVASDSNQASFSNGGFQSMNPENGALSEDEQMESQNPHPSQFSPAEPAGRQTSYMESHLEGSESMHDSERKQQEVSADSNQAVSRNEDFKSLDPEKVAFSEDEMENMEESKHDAVLPNQDTCVHSDGLSAPIQ